MRTIHILLLCILGAALLPPVISERGPDDCCFTFYPRRVKLNLVVSYYVTDHRCPRAGVILVTKKKNRICADPVLSWVERIMKTVDEGSF